MKEKSKEFLRQLKTKQLQLFFFIALVILGCNDLDKSEKKGSQNELNLDQFLEKNQEKLVFLSFYPGMPRQMENEAIDFEINNGNLTRDRTNTYYTMTTEKGVHELKFSVGSDRISLVYAFPSKYYYSSTAHMSNFEYFVEVYSEKYDVVHHSQDSVVFNGDSKKITITEYYKSWSKIDYNGFRTPARLNNEDFYQSSAVYINYYDDKTFEEIVDRIRDRELKNKRRIETENQKTRDEHEKKKQLTKDQI